MREINCIINYVSLLTCVIFINSFFLIVPVEVKTVTFELNLATDIEFSEALTDTSSEAYQLAAQGVKDVFITEMEMMAMNTGMELVGMEVAFASDVGDRRKRRAISTSATITVYFTVDVAGFGAAFDFGAFLSELTSVIQEVAAKAIAASPGTHININAVVTVIDTTPEDPVTIDGMLYEITCFSCFTLN